MKIETYFQYQQIIEIKKGVSIKLTPFFISRFGCSVRLVLCAQTLFDTRRPTSTLTQVVQFSLANSTTTLDSDAVNYW